MFCSSKFVQIFQKMLWPFEMHFQTANPKKPKQGVSQVLRLRIWVFCTNRMFACLREDRPFPKAIELSKHPTSRRMNSPPRRDCQGLSDQGLNLTAFHPGQTNAHKAHPYGSPELSLRGNVS